MKKELWLMLSFSKCLNITNEEILIGLTYSWPGVSCAATGNPGEVEHVGSHCNKIQVSHQTVIKISLFCGNSKCFTGWVCCLSKTLLIYY
jgi:hypothetical protein